MPHVFQRPLANQHGFVRAAVVQYDIDLHIRRRHPVNDRQELPASRRSGASCSSDGSPRRWQGRRSRPARSRRGARNRACSARAVLVSATAGPRCGRALGPATSRPRRAPLPLPARSATSRPRPAHSGRTTGRSTARIARCGVACGRRGVSQPSHRCPCRTDISVGA